MENVTQVHGTKNKEHFDEWITFLESKGYKNYWKDLNAKNFCIPQNRNRTFMVSVLGDYTYEFPQEFPLNKRLKDLLEKEVDEKFYISNERVESIVNSTFAQEKTRIQKTDVCGTLLARDYKDPKCVEVEPLAYDEQNGYIRKDGTVGTLTTDGSLPKHNNRVIEFAKEVVNSGVLETESAEIYSYDGYNNKINKSDCIGTVVPQNSRWGLTNGYKIVEVEPNNKTIENCYVSEKGVKYILDSKRGMATDVNADVCQPLTAKGQANWTGSFISPNIESIEKSSTIGGTEPTKINLKNGQTIYFDGENFCEEEPKVIGGIGSVEKTEQLLSDVQNGKYPQDTAYGKYLFQSSRFDDKPLEECAQTIKSTKVDCGVIHNLRIRKLTPKECWRLMGFTDEDFEKAAQYNSNSQLYKQAGNSIVVSVLYYIFKGMF
jgi:DNA (cytosine-5)-methyltransferase 1